MGCDWSRNPAGFIGPVRGPVPAEPEVVGIDYERQLPANKSIYVGESARFLLVFDPADFICNENDFSTTDDDVTVTMEEGANNVVRISVGETVGAGSVVEVRFRDQLFMLLDVVAVPKVIEESIIPVGSSISTGGNVSGLYLPTDKTLYEVDAKLTGNDYDLDLHFQYDSGNVNLTCKDSDIPSDIGYLTVYLQDSIKRVVFRSNETVTMQWTLNVLRITYDGDQIFP